MFVNTQMFEEAYMGAALYNGQGPMLPLPPWMGPDMEATVPHPSTGQECSVQRMGGVRWPRGCVYR
jgi:hypothetical protein